MSRFEMVGLEREVAGCLERWRKLDVGRRIWLRDPGLWHPGARPDEEIADLSNRLGWLTLPREMASSVADLENFSREVEAAGYERVVVLGMGGSSLIAEVWERVYGPLACGLPLMVLDSTHPAAVAAVESCGRLDKALFLVASKSGGTLETLSFADYFYSRLAALVPDPGSHFVALTDPGSDLERLAAERGYRRVFATPPEVGGRFSALTRFGLLPAALKGLDIAALLASGRKMMQACGPEIPVAENPALRLGALWGQMAIAGCDKLGLVFSARLAPVAIWLEQLLAESTGKQGRGLLPVTVSPEMLVPGAGREVLGWGGSAAQDFGWLFLGMAGAEEPEFTAAWERVEVSGRPAARIEITDLAELGGELWRFEMATAAAAIELGINPFDQPDVEAAKIGARRALAAVAEEGRLPQPEGFLDTGAGDLCFFGSSHFSAVTSEAAVWERLLALCRPGDYLALLAYLPPTPENDLWLARVRSMLEGRYRLPVVIGYGPRYLHSTGQLFKGGSGNGIFIQVLGELTADRPLPGVGYGFKTLITAQARGDFGALVAAGRRVLLLEAPGLGAAELEARLEFVGKELG